MESMERERETFRRPCYVEKKESSPVEIRYTRIEIYARVYILIDVIIVSLYAAERNYKRARGIQQSTATGI